MDPDDGGSFWGLALLVQLLVKLSQGVDGGVGEQLVHLRVSLKNTEAMIMLDSLREFDDLDRADIFKHRLGTILEISQYTHFVYNLCHF